MEVGLAESLWIWYGDMPLYCFFLFGVNRRDALPGFYDETSDMYGVVFRGIEI